MTTFSSLISRSVTMPAVCKHTTRCVWFANRIFRVCFKTLKSAELGLVAINPSDGGLLCANHGTDTTSHSIFESTSACRRSVRYHAGGIDRVRHSADQNKKRRIQPARGRAEDMDIHALF